MRKYACELEERELPLNFALVRHTSTCSAVSPQDAPYLLEPLAQSFASEDAVVKLTLLSAAAKLFFQRPPECQALLGCALAAAVADTDQDVHDRGLMYYRSLTYPAFYPCCRVDTLVCFNVHV